MTHRTMSERSYHGATSRSFVYRMLPYMAASGHNLYTKSLHIYLQNCSANILKCTKDSSRAYMLFADQTDSGLVFQLTAAPEYVIELVRCACNGDCSNKTWLLQNWSAQSHVVSAGVYVQMEMTRRTFLIYRC